MRSYCTLIICVFVLFASCYGFLFRNNRYREKMFDITLSRANAENGDDIPPRQYFAQKLDHFRPVDNTTWNQAYWVMEKYYKNGGPVYLFIGGEAPARPLWLNYGLWSKHGKKNNAILFLLEHRYYGTSRPTENTSTENLKYLTTQQALGDLSHFIRAMKIKYNLGENKKWIVFGGSYPGNLAAWARLKYPHLIHGAISSSAPVLAQADFPEYFDVVRDSLASYKKQCVTDITAANRRLDRMVKTKKGRKRIDKYYNLCKPLKNNQMDISCFFTNLADIYAYNVQYNRNSTTGSSISRICDKLLENSTTISAWIRYGKVAKMMLEMYGQQCMDTEYENFANDMKKTDWISSTNTYRAWVYQTCSEYGYYQTSSKITDTFGRHFPIDFYLRVCRDSFGTQFDKHLLDNVVHKTNTFYGGLSINTSNIVFVHGSIDPWHALGITSVEEKMAHKVIYIPGSSHCEDMRETRSGDSDELKNARTEIERTLDGWLKET